MPSERSRFQSSRYSGAIPCILKQLAEKFIFTLSSSSGSIEFVAVSPADYTPWYLAPRPTANYHSHLFPQEMLCSGRRRYFQLTALRMTSCLASDSSVGVYSPALSTIASPTPPPRRSAVTYRTVSATVSLHSSAGVFTNLRTQVRHRQTEKQC
ncbi:hypothetical protein EX30DRAFT_179188 [Ascodesmis nigricans]|uniref:Uncharacterized protein n=1 Tax=Ascodesmis nigricans TaxID=341454 RepID=A0A4S2MRK6_9PEZI|nr:hypothetical protein EX30DRAFT_179188 [Ascodesmis nigricans]